MVDAVQMRQYRNPRLGLHPRHQALPPPRNNQVDRAFRGEHRADRGPVRGRYQLHHIRRQASFGKAVCESRMDRPVAVRRFGTAAQDCGIAGHHRQRRGIRRHVRPTFIDDAQHAERHAHTCEFEPVGAGARVDHFTHRVRQCRHRFDGIRDSLNTSGIQSQPVLHRAGQIVGHSPCHILGIGQEDPSQFRAYGLGGCTKAICLGRSRLMGERP